MTDARNKYFMNPASLVIPDHAWAPCGGEHGDGPSRLLARVIISGVDFHVEAYEVKYVNDVQEIVDPVFMDEWEAICALEPNDPLQTNTIMGREYVLIARPYAV